VRGPAVQITNPVHDIVAHALLLNFTVLLKYPMLAGEYPLVFGRFIFIKSDESSLVLIP
jgi:hypothetical protein